MINHEALSSLFELAIDRLDFATKYDEFTPGFFDDFLAVADIINAFGTPFSGRELVESSDKRRCVGSNPDGSDEYVRTISVSIWNPISRTESFLGSGEWRESEQFSWESGVEKSDSRSQRTRDFPISGFENQLRRLLTGFRYFVVDVSHTDAIRLAEPKFNFRTKNIVGRYAVINSDLPQAMHTLLATTHLLPSSEALIRYFYLPDAAEEIVNALKIQNTDGSIEQEAATAGADHIIENRKKILQNYSLVDGMLSTPKGRFSVSAALQQFVEHLIVNSPMVTRAVDHAVQSSQIPPKWRHEKGGFLCKNNAGFFLSPD